VSADLYAEATLPSDVASSLRQLLAAGSFVRSEVTGWAAASETGTGRRENQDAWGQRNGTFVVADGMGGRPGGSTAATVAVAAALDAFDDVEVLHPLDWSARLAAVNDSVILAARRAGHQGAGAALAVVRCLDGRVVASHLGDVRIYRLRQGETQLLTRDHNVASELNAAGRDPNTLEAARGKTAALTSFVGAPAAWQRHSLRVIDARPDDILVMCTDGVHRRLERHDWEVARTAADSQVLVDQLLQRAVAAGSSDDRTALAIRIGALR